MVDRLFRGTGSNSFFIFGPRGAGKSYWLKNKFANRSDVFWLDLLDDATEEAYSQKPGLLREKLLKKPYPHVVIDEVQKIPKLLDIVHLCIENLATKRTQFIMTGSSSRKLKRGGANLLAGRAFLYFMHPYSARELGVDFDLSSALCYGMLPKVHELGTPEDKKEFLKSYVRNYLKEEIRIEQLVRKLDPFRRFLEVSAQCNGKIINFSNIARDVGVDDKTVENYYSILEDTLIGFFLPAFHRSIRKQQHQAPKFYYFDTGVKKTLENTQDVLVVPGTYEYGNAFEHFILLEVMKLNEYSRKDYRFYYLRTKAGVEIDLVIERPGMPYALVEIKSSNRVQDRDLNALLSFSKNFKKPDLFCWCNEKTGRISKGVTLLNWAEGIKEVGL